MIKLVLKSYNDGEELETIVDNEEDIVSFSTSYNVETNETIAYAFESTVELVRDDGDVDNEHMSDIVNDFYGFYILRTPEDINDFTNRVGDYEDV